MPISSPSHHRVFPGYNQELLLSDIQFEPELEFQGEVSDDEKRHLAKGVSGKIRLYLPFTGQVREMSAV